MLLADGAPTGAGLAIVGVILLTLFAIFLLIVFFVVRGVIRLARRNRRKDDVSSVPTGPPPQAP